MLSCRSKQSLHDSKGVGTQTKFSLKLNIIIPYYLVTYFPLTFNVYYDTDHLFTLEELTHFRVISPLSGATLTRH